MIELQNQTSVLFFHETINDAGVAIIDAAQIFDLVFEMGNLFLRVFADGLDFVLVVFMELFDFSFVKRNSAGACSALQKRSVTRIGSRAKDGQLNGTRGFAHDVLAVTFRRQFLFNGLCGNGNAKIISAFGNLSIGQLFHPFHVAHEFAPAFNGHVGSAGAIAGRTPVVTIQAKVIGFFFQILFA